MHLVLFAHLRRLRAEIGDGARQGFEGVGAAFGEGQEAQLGLLIERHTHVRAGIGCVHRGAGCLGV